MSAVLVSAAMLFLLVGSTASAAVADVPAADSRSDEQLRASGGGSTTDAIVTVRSGRSVGTGFVVGPGEIITAAHVVEAGASTTVQVAGHEFEASVVASDAGVDLALLAVTTMQFPGLRLATALPPVGGQLTAYSAADGVVAATRGIVSAYESIREVPHLRTDAAVNAGSSGGPLVDEADQVVGVIVTKAESAEGIAHAVTVEVVRDFLAMRPEHPEALQSDDDSASILSARVLGSSLAGLALAIAVAITRGLRRRGRQPPADIKLGRSRIRLDTDSMARTNTGGMDGS